MIEKAPQIIFDAVKQLGDTALRAIGRRINPWPVDYDIGEYIAQVAEEYYDTP